MDRKIFYKLIYLWKRELGVRGDWESLGFFFGFSGDLMEFGRVLYVYRVWCGKNRDFVFGYVSVLRS